MFDTIILLTGPVEQAVLASALLGHKPALTIHWAASTDELIRFDAATLARSRLVAFATPVIVPSDVLDGLGYGAYNFHPGPPAYPGWAPAHFALYEGATDFGVTVHAMAARVDSGPIVEAVHFSVPAGIGVQGLEGLAYAHLAQLFWRLAKYLATESDPLPLCALQWGHRTYSRRSYRAICDIPLDISKEELDHRLRVFGGNDWGMSPAINLHGVEFRAVTANSPSPAI
jgi:methionyl-tRNA formyltransferase